LPVQIPDPLMEAAKARPLRQIIDSRSLPLRGVNMIYYALLFLAAGLITGVLNFTGMSSLPVEIPLVLSLIGIVLGATYVFIGRTARIA
jgi:uncharacterized membrane protein YtjA (UPF0391 family)